MKFTAKEKYALESALDGYIKGLLRDIQKWSNDVAVEACKVIGVGRISHGKNKIIIRLMSAESVLDRLRGWLKPTGRFIRDGRGNRHRGKEIPLPMICK